MADNFYAKYSANEPPVVVTSVNGLNGALTLAAGSGISITPSGNTLTIASTASGANTALSNLTSTAVNVDLLPGITDTLDLGSVAKRWANLHVSNITDGPGNVEIDLINGLIETGGNAVLSFTSRVLSDQSSQPSVNAQTRLLIDPSGFTSIAYNSRTLNTNDTGASVLSWGSNMVNILLGKSLGFNGATSGEVDIHAPSVVSTYSLILPNAQGAASTFLQNDGSGNLSWASGGGGSSVNIFAADAVDENGVNTSNPATATFDGVTLSAGQILFELGNLDATNGLWVFHGIGVAMTRPINWSNGSTIPSNSWIIVAPGGATYGGNLLGNPTPVLVGTDTPNTVLLPASTASGSFTTVDSKTVTVSNGLITSIV